MRYEDGQTLPADATVQDLFRGNFDQKVLPLKERLVMNYHADRRTFGAIPIVQAFGIVSSDDIRNMAGIIHDDINQDRVRPMIDIVTDAGMVKAAPWFKRGDIQRNPILNNFALGYTPEEMGEWDQEQHLRDLETGITEAEILAGRGPDRAVRRDFLEAGRGNFDIVPDPHNPKRTLFGNTSGGDIQYAKTLNVRFNYFPWENYPAMLIILGRNDTDLRIEPRHQ